MRQTHMRLKCLMVVCFCTCSMVYAQHGNKLQLVFNPTFNQKIYQAGDSITIAANTVILEKIKFYLSNIQFNLKNKLVFNEPSSYHLLSLLETKKNSISLDVPNNLIYDEIVFNLGIDSTTNSSGVIGGDLDPTNGMYWTWQSGYINMKMEGYCATCTTRNHFFEFHLGGYQFPFAAVQTVKIKVAKGNLFNIGFDLEKFFGQTDLVKKCAIMSPGNETVQLSQQAANSFYLIK
jgi:hypothetical protein